MPAVDVLRQSWLQLQGYMEIGGVVMWPLAAISMVMWALIVNRLLYLRQLHRRAMGLDAALEHVRAERMPDPGQYGGAVALLVTGFLAARTGDHRFDRYILDQTVIRLNRSLVDYLAVIGVLAAVAPLLGLLGTVTGMIATFDILALFGTGNARAMAAGISEALVTTQTGLLVAIPGLYMKGFLDRRASNLSKRVEAAGLFLRRQL